MNALIHRSYRENSPIQIIRYPNRIEISNPGFSLKNEEHLGEPGSVNRNPYIAAIFHETNLAETKGSGIKTMRILMEEAGMMPPTFESDREKNKFTIRLLLHHLLDENDITWLAYFEQYELTDNQKRILIFIREVGAINNSVTRQINGYESSNANYDLRRLKELQLIEAKGKSRYTYYLPSSKFFELNGGNLGSISDSKVDSEAYLPSLSTKLPSLPTKLKKLPIRLDNLDEGKIEKLLSLKQEIDLLPSRIEEKKIISNLILELCEVQEFKKGELAIWLHRSEKYIYNDYIKPLLEKGRLKYTFPDMVSHPEQAYRTVKKSKR